MAFSNPLPDNKYVLEHLTRMLADFNPSFIFNGWWGCPDNGAVSAHLPFYRAFRSIPMLDFKKVPGASDPVQVKYGELENAGYILIVNREYYPVGLNMTLNSESKELLDLASNTPVKLQDGRLSMQVKPYEVICLKSAATVTFKETAMTVPPEVIKELEKTLAAVKQAAKTFNAKRLRVAGLPELIPIADAALAKKQYSYLHYLLQSGPATEALKHENALK